MANQIAPDIPATGKAPTSREERARKRIVSNYRRLIRDYMGRISRNARAYVNKRTHSGNQSAVKLRKVLQTATFIAAHPTRFHAGGYVVEETKYFVLHRPGVHAKASRLDNIIREFVQAHRKASAHFVISQAGALVQMVDLGDIAYHCGPSSPAINSNSVGVELEGAIGQPMSQAMLDSLANLIAVIAQLSGMPINVHTILNHSTILPQQKRDAWVPRRVQGEIKDSKILQIISAAEAVRSRMTSAGVSDFFKPPFDPREDMANKISEILALAAAPGTSYIEMARLQAAAGNAAAFNRRASFAAMGQDRTGLGAAAATHAAGLQEQTAQSLAAFIRDNSIAAEPTPQENNEGVLYDQETGLMNDGRAP